MTQRRVSTIWSAVHDERHALARDLEGLPVAAWSTPSLCDGWDVHEVTAHLIDTAKTTRLGFIRRMIACRFDFDRDNATGVAREKAADPLHTLEAFRAVSARTSTPPAALATRLVEAFVHDEDIRRPLGIKHEYPPTHLATALEYQVKTNVSMGGGKQLAQGCRQVATDAAFEHGDGPTVTGPAITLLLAISGRPVTEEELAGPGTQAFCTARAAQF